MKINRKNKLIFFKIITLIGFLGLLMKIYFITSNYSYIFNGYDSSTIMEHIQGMIKLQTYNVDTISRPFEAYLASIIRIITGIPTSETMLLNTVISPIICFFLCYILALELFNEKIIAYLSSSFFAYGIIFFQINSILYYSFTFLPLLFIITIKYFKGKTNIGALALALFAGINIYSQINIIYLFLISAFVFFLQLKAVKTKNAFLVKKSSNYFLILLVTLALNFYLLNNVLPDYLKGFKRALWFLAGLQRTNMFIIEYIYKGFFFLVFLCLILFSIRFYYKKFKLYRNNSLIKSLKSFNKKLSKYTIWKTLKFDYWLSFFAIIIGGLAITDLVLSIYKINYSQQFNIFINKWSNTFLIFSRFLNQEVWRENVYLISLLFFIGTFGTLFLIFYYKEKHTDDYFKLILIPFFLLFVEIIPGATKIGLSNYGGMRGIYANSSIIVVVFSYVLVKLLYKKYKLLFYTITGSLVVILAYNSLIITKWYSNNNRPEDSFIEAVKWFDKNKKNDSFIYLDPYPFPGSVAKKPEKFDSFLLFEGSTNLYSFFNKYYIYSFFASDVPFSINDEINQNLLYFKNTKLFYSLLKKHNIEYLILASEYNYNNLKGYIDPISKTIYQNKKMYILEYTDYNL